MKQRSRYKKCPRDLEEYALCTYVLSAGLYMTFVENASKCNVKPSNA